MRSQFIEQVQILMDIQQIKTAERIFGKSNYHWLCSKSISMIWLSPRDEFKLRQALKKITERQQVQVMKQLLSWLDLNPEAHPLKVPEVSLSFIESLQTDEVLKNVTFSRISSFRNSLKRFSIRKNALKPDSLKIEDFKPRRSVTFNEVPMVYCISVK